MYQTPNQKEFTVTDSYKKMRCVCTIDNLLGICFRKLLAFLFVRSRFSCLSINEGLVPFNILNVFCQNHKIYRQIFDDAKFS